eukprot:1717106-Amphidinium_carterae.1
MSVLKTFSRTCGPMGASARAARNKSPGVWYLGLELCRSANWTVNSPQMEIEQVHFGTNECFVLNQQHSDKNNW